MYTIEVYETSSGRRPLQKFLTKMAKSGNVQEYAQITAAIKLLEKYGRDTNLYDKELVKHIQDDLYELRPGPNRVFYFYFDGDTIVLLHAMRKDSQKTRKKEIQLAIQEIKDYKGRHTDGRASNVRSDDRGDQKPGRKGKANH